MKFKVQRGLVEVKARSAIHDTTTRFAKIEGTIDFDPDDPGTARAELAVDMRVYDAGDRFKNWKLKTDLEPDTYPTATFVLSSVDDVHEPLAGRFQAKATGQIGWRDRKVSVKLSGQASVDRRTVDARATFTMNVRDLGVAPPRFLMFKVEDEVLVQVSLVAFATAS